MGRIFRPTNLVRDASGNPIIGADGQPLRKARTRIWYIRYYDANGKAHDESSGSTKIGDAKRLLTAREAAKDRGEPVGTRIGKVTFDDAADDIINDYKLNARRSIANLTSRIDKHLRPVFGGRRLANITTSDVKAFSVARLEAKASKAEVNRELAILKRMFSLAMQAGKLLQKPHIPMLREQNARTGFFERDSFEAVRAHLPEYLRPVATFAYITGWRVISEVLPLRVSQVDLGAGVVSLEAFTTKNDQARTFDFGPIVELRETLSAQIDSAERVSRAHTRIVQTVFHEPDGSPISTKRLYKAWRAACTSAGYPGRLLHDFRRSAVRNLVRAGISEGVAMKMTGHKTRSVFERYNIGSKRDLHEAAAKLQAFMTGEPATSTTGARVRPFRKGA